MGPNGHSRATTPSPEPQPLALNTTQKAGLRTETYVEANQTRLQEEESKACVMRNSYSEIPFHYLETTGDFYRKEKK